MKWIFFFIKGVFWEADKKDAIERERERIIFRRSIEEKGRVTRIEEKEICGQIQV